jgi:WD40 repeat protein
MAIEQPKLQIIGHSGSVTSLIFSADGKSLVSGSTDKTAIVWDVETGRLQRILDLNGYVQCLLPTPESHIAVGDAEQMWDAETGRSLRRLSYHWAMAGSPDGKAIAYTTDAPGSEHSTIVLEDAHAGRTIQQFEVGELGYHNFGYFQPLTFSADSELVAVTGRNDEVMYTVICNRRTSEIRRVLVGEAVALF